MVISGSVIGGPIEVVLGREAVQFYDMDYLTKWKMQQLVSEADGPQQRQLSCRTKAET